MPAPFYDRLVKHYRALAAALQDDSQLAAVFPNTSDIGSIREQVIGNFLKRHLPSKLNVLYGGFLFHLDGRESKQLDIIVTTDTTPQFSVTEDESPKSFAPVEGTVGVISSKSSLSKGHLAKALKEFSSIPPTEPLAGRLPHTMTYPQGNYDDWPYKILISKTGPKAVTVKRNIEGFYATHPEIPESRRPNMVYVPGEFFILRASSEFNTKNPQGLSPSHNTFTIVVKDPDPQALSMMVIALQRRAFLST